MTIEEQPLYCGGCGELIPFPELSDRSPGAYAYMREQAGANAGRTTWRHAEHVVHECVDGSFLPPDRTAVPKIL